MKRGGELNQIQNQLSLICADTPEWHQFTKLCEQMKNNDKAAWEWLVQCVQMKQQFNVNIYKMFENGGMRVKV